jgi:phage-related protein
MKPVRFLGRAREELRAFPTEARRTAGQQLYRAQTGNRPWDVKPLPTVGAGVEEIRVRMASGAFRVLYVAKFAEAVYVLHACEKRSQKTPRQALDTGRTRYRELLAFRRMRWPE